jgi:O-antigen ligase
MSKRLFVTGIFVASAFVDAPSYFSVGAISLMGVLTILYAVGIAFLLLWRPRAALSALLQIWPLPALLLFSLLQCLWHSPTVQGVQTLCLQWIFVGLIVLMMIGEKNGLDHVAVARLLLYAVAVGSLCFVGVFIFLGFGAEGIGAISFVAARSFALFALLGVGLFLGRSANGSRASLWLAACLILLIALSLSRAALVVGVFLFPLSRFGSLSLRDFKRLLIIGGIAALGLYYLVSSIDTLRLRFVGNNSLDDYISGDASVDTSGRITTWAVTLSSYLESPWLGKGPGSANDLIDSLLSRSNLGHPLNEYLRFLHDEGLFGLALLLGGYGQLLVLCRRAYRNSLEVRSSYSSFHLATFLVLVAALMTMFTDNTASYIYVMAPLGIMVGTTLRSLGEKEHTVSARAFKTHAKPLSPSINGTPAECKP